MKNSIEKNLRSKIINYHYKLVDRKIVPCDNLHEWATWFETADRVIKRTEIQDVLVSTVFLGLEYPFVRVPILFETMVFGGQYDEKCERYATLEEAENGHERVCDLVFGDWGQVAKLNEN